MLDKTEIFEVVCYPTGEVIYPNELEFYNLYENDLIHFSGLKEFWYIKEKDIEQSKLYYKQK